MIISPIAFPVVHRPAGNTCPVRERFTRRLITGSIALDVGLAGNGWPVSAPE